ncbi:uncharacterized protein TNCV_4456191 [Trichonephila clavipes]|nr:uncharacterized protein TNCV_4456191 [Trichonephila clavipes]
MALKEGRFVLGTFRSERMRVLNRSRQNDRLRVMLVLVPIDITPPHTPLPVFRRIGERTIPYSWRACKQLRHLVSCVIRSRRLENCVICVRRLENSVICVRRLENCVICGAVQITARVTNEGRKVRSGYLPYRTNASTLPITSKQSSSLDVGTSSYRYRTTTAFTVT